MTSPSDPTTSQLAEASQEALGELFARDPLQLSEQNIDTIVFSLRKERERWAKDEASGTKGAKAHKTPSPPNPESKKLEIADLDLKL